ncbi:MAG: YqaE/Pmp3 family membrane protein [Lentisphaeria bacterium]
MLIRILPAIIFPPLAVYDKGCGVILLVLTGLGCLPGTLAELICPNHKD